MDDETAYLAATVDRAAALQERTGLPLSVLLEALALVADGDEAGAEAVLRRALEERSA